MDFVKAFLVGGAFCAIGQILIDRTRLTPARILVGYVVAGALLTLLGVYRPLVEFAGAGATIPLTGFGYCLANGAKEGVEAYGLAGALIGGLASVSGGVTVAVLCGFLAGLFGKPKAK